MTKPKRVRTGCLTCRERHLKCDEHLPNCNNCRKSSRHCKRGVRLNFIDTTVRDPPLLPKTADWKVYFQDESRDIASEYKGGLDQYDRRFPQTIPGPPARRPYERPSLSSQIVLPDDNTSWLQIPRHDLFVSKPLHIKPEPPESRISNQDPPTARNAPKTYLPPPISYYDVDSIPSPLHDWEMSYLKSAEELLLMQVFVEEVGIWMDSMDSMKHFSRQLPFQALGEPMLLNAFLACGARHLTLVNPNYHEDKALLYYDTATTQLLRALQNPERDTMCCATTAVILNVYEIMSDRAMQRMNHIAGARALIKECGWNAKSTGIGSACFWLNVGMELLSCLHFNWQIAWEPDQWGVDLNFQQDLGVGKEEVWVHRILYIIGKIANFRALASESQQDSPDEGHISAQEEQIRVQARLSEWRKLKSLCECWNQSIPRTMQPIGYLHPSQTTSLSAFPEIWLIKRATIVGRLFYHTAMILLAQVHPLKSRQNEEMKTVQLDHAHMICGITAHVKDRGVASVALRSLAIAAECLVIRREQEEILEIFEKIRKETGWKVGFLYKELHAKWGLESEAQQLSIPIPSPRQQPPSTLNHSQPAPVPAQQQRTMLNGGILNPLLAKADFSLPNHPYQQHYQPPSQNHQSNSSSQSCISKI
ncbi:putative C6 zinc finger domain-containing protein [Blumeria hordei DH14]|uniref:Putative C6 zinc finger domain-containing protein n=1 Tax=Blumeria graminis f. sp. hordei (strain DH14) TaxID=546991 RepID=N1JAB9_BLUG1|nr:putative C6 zinc finger domain-containing protein [Blumeria hordei DH14]